MPHHSRIVAPKTRESGKRKKANDSHKKNVAFEMTPKKIFPQEGGKFFVTISKVS